MSRRARTFWVLAVVAAVLVASGVAIDFWRGPRAYVQVENAGTEPIDDLVLTWAGQRMALGRVAPEASIQVLIAGRATGPLVARFNQKGNPLGACEVEGFSPALLNRDGFKQVIRVGFNQVERYPEDSEPTTLVGRLVWGLYDRLRDSLQPPPAP